MDHKSLLLGLLVALLASSAASKMGRYPVTGLVQSGVAGATISIDPDACVLPFTLPCSAAGQ